MPEALHKVTEAQQKEQDAIKDQQDLDRKQLEDRRVKAIKELEDKRSELEFLPKSLWRSLRRRS